MSTTKPEVVYVTSLAVSGFLNGIVNLGFSTAQFLPELVPDPDEKGQYVTKVMAAEVMTANLRFDLLVAQQVHDALGKMIEQHTKPKVMDS